MQDPELERKEEEIKAGQLEKARQLVAAMEAGDDLPANRLIEELGRMHESVLFQELGKLTRDLHEALNAFRLDSRLAEIAQNEIPDAKERLNYVVAMTEQAAHRTLNAVEDCLPKAEYLSRQARDLGESWAKFRKRELSAEEFRVLSKALSEFLVHSAEDGEAIRRNLSDVLMAQGFQDLTGQVIRRVIDLVQDVEKNLVGLVRITGERLSAPEQKKTSEPKIAKESSPQPARDVTAAGPAVPGTKEANDVVSGQDDVDDLLSSLGF